MVETVKASFTYLTALLIIVGGGAMLFFTYADSAAQNLQLIVSGLMGAAMQFLFNRETQTQTARQAASATAAAAAAQPTTILSAGPPATVTSTPGTPVEEDLP
jgi:membrane associated rhomboid family serine protease